MHVNRFAASVAFLLAALAGPALAQSEDASQQPAENPPAAQSQPPAQQSAAKPPETHTYSDWTMRCFPVASPAPCDVFQASIEKKTKQRVMSASIAWAPARDIYAVQFVVPLGVSLAKGLALEAGSYKVENVPFRRCTREGCFVESAIDPKAIQAMASSSKAVLKITAYNGKGFDLPMSLKGFSAALNAMKAAARQKATTPPAKPATDTNQ